MSAATDAAIDYILTNEGGDADVAGDRGGKTRCGISWASYPNDPIFELVSLQDAQARARQIYLRDFVTPLGLDDRHPRILAKVADFAVVAGPERSAKALQRALNACGARLTEDGAIGSATRAAIDVQVVRNGDACLLAQLCREQCLHFLFVAATHSQRQFLMGWVSRAMRLPPMPACEHRSTYKDTGEPRRCRDCGARIENGVAA